MTATSPVPYENIFSWNPSLPLSDKNDPNQLPSIIKMNEISENPASISFRKACHRHNANKLDCIIAIKLYCDWNWNSLKLDNFTHISLDCLNESAITSVSIRSAVVFVVGLLIIYIRRWLIHFDDTMMWKWRFSFSSCLCNCPISS